MASTIPGPRLQANAVWETLIFLLNGLAFMLLGLQLPAILAVLLSTIVPHSHILLAWHAVLIYLTFAVILATLVVQ